MIVGNADLHGMNVSLLHRDGVVSLAPCYDVMSTTAWSDDVSTGLGLLVGGANDVNEVTMADVVDEAVGWGLRMHAVESTIDGLLDRMPEALDEAANIELPQPGSFPEQLLQHIEGRLQRARLDRSAPLGLP